MSFLPYVGLRLHGARRDVPWAKEWSIDILAVAAVFMFPRYISAAVLFIHECNCSYFNRLAFVSLSNNLMILCALFRFMLRGL
jgi:hypothetical protein